MTTSPKEITQMLIAWERGDQAALHKLMPMVYKELHRIAKHYMKAQTPDHTLQTTALIHEAYLKLVGQKDRSLKNRSHFFRVAAKAMKQILIDYARSRSRVKRGGGVKEVSLDEGATISIERAEEVIAIHDALNALSAIDKRKAEVVELRFFGGLTETETADVLGVSVDTIKRDWRLAKIWLRREVSEKTDEL